MYRTVPNRLPTPVCPPLVPAASRHLHSTGTYLARWVGYLLYYSTVSGVPAVLSLFSSRATSTPDRASSLLAGVRAHPLNQI